MARLVKNALDLREVVSVDQGFGGGRIEGGEDTVFFEIGIETLADVDGLYVFI